MTAAHAPVWLVPADVAVWLQLKAPDASTTELLAVCSAAVEPQVERARPDMRVFYDPDDPNPPDPPPPGWPVVFTPDAEVYQAAVMLAGRLFRRRNSPGGIEAVADIGGLYVSRYDPEIERALHTGAWRRGAWL
jgi:hypothetical protein